MTFSSWYKHAIHLLTFGVAFPPPKPVITPARVALDQLEKAQFDLLEHKHLAEYHNSMVTMLTERIPRLHEDLNALNNAHAYRSSQ